MTGYRTIKELTEGWGSRSRRTILRWIASGKLISVIVDGQQVIPIDANRDLLHSMRQQSRPRRTLDVWVPDEIPDYAKWHDVLDCIVWLLLTVHSTPQVVKQKAFRLDSLLVNYLGNADFDIRRVKKAFKACAQPNRSMSAKDLRRAWYHELSFSVPLRTDTIDLSSRAVTRSLSSSSLRFAFPTWKIVSCYYATYFFVRSAAYLKYGQIRAEQHMAAANAFKNNLASSLEQTIWRYPLSMCAYADENAFAVKPACPGLGHLARQYSQHPRNPYRSPKELHKVVAAFYKNRLRKCGASSYGIIDFLRELRVWANYQDVDNLLKLHSAGFKAYLDRNLSAISFMIAAVSELSYISVVGPSRYVRLLQLHYDAIARDGNAMQRDIVWSPPMQRLEIYKRMGILEQGVSFKEIENPHAVIM